jgi:hypothetical protein
MPADVARQLQCRRWWALLRVVRAAVHAVCLLLLRFDMFAALSESMSLMVKGLSVCTHAHAEHTASKKSRVTRCSHYTLHVLL